MEKKQIYGIIRHALTVLGGALVTKGYIDDALLIEGVGAVMAIIGFVWSYSEKTKA